MPKYQLADKKVLHQKRKLRSRNSRLNNQGRSSSTTKLSFPSNGEDYLGSGKYKIFDFSVLNLEGLNKTKECCTRKRGSRNLPCECPLGVACPRVAFMTTGESMPIFRTGKQYTKRSLYSIYGLLVLLVGITYNLDSIKQCLLVRVKSSAVLHRSIIQRHARSRNLLLVWLDTSQNISPQPLRQECLGSEAFSVLPSRLFNGVSLVYNPRTLSLIFSLAFPFSPHL